MDALIVGLGSSGRRHAGILHRLPGIDRLTVVTKQQSSKFECAADLGRIERLDTYGYIVIATETHRHFEQLTHVLERTGGATVLVEKPLFQQYKPMDIGSRRVFVGYNLRFHPVLQAIKQEILGERVLYANVLAGQYLPDWRPDRDYRACYSASSARGGGVLLDLSHEIDYCQWLFGGFADVVARDEKVSSLEINTDDLVCGTAKTVTGCVVCFSMDYISKTSQRRILVHTETKTVIGDLIAGSLTVQRASEPLVRTTFARLEREWTYRKMHEAILGGDAKDVCSFQEGQSVLRVVDRVVQAGKGTASE
jgi:predicted dehydrogenase